MDYKDLKSGGANYRKEAELNEGNRILFNNEKLLFPVCRNLVLW
jgi:hypothetical protein